MSDTAIPRSILDRGDGATVPSAARAPDRSAPNAIEKIFLHGGQIFASSKPAHVTTIVGSCVAVCLWDRTTEIGGINHYILPVGKGRRKGDDGRFGQRAIPRLIDHLIGLGGSRANLVAKVFGGANVINAISGGKTHVGTRNVDLAIEMLSDEGIPIVARDVAGSRGRKLIFQTQDGVVRVKRL